MKVFKACLLYCSRSLQRRIMSTSLLLLLALNLISIMFIVHHTHAEIAEIFGAQQAQLARTINQVIHDLESDNTLTSSVSPVPQFLDEDHENQFGHYYEQKIAYQIWDLDGNLLLRSANAPLEPLNQTKKGFQTVKIQDTNWHVFGVFSDVTKRWIYTAQNQESREELVNYIVRDYVFNLMLINSVVILILALGVVYGLKPIQAFSKALRQKNADHLEPIDVAFCEELIPIQNNVNLLLHRLEKTLAQEKAFNADVSHELRTPLAAIKIHGHNIQQQEPLTAAGQNAIQRILDAIDDMTEIIEQLLLLDRLESASTATTLIDLHHLAKQVLAGLPETMHDTHPFELLGERSYIQGHEALLNLLIRNLVENSVKYSAANTPIIISISSTQSEVKLEVIDQGPGMTEEQKTNALKRRYRVSDSQTYGSGLGLSIAQKIVNLHAGQLAFLDTPTGSGLQVNVRFHPSITP